MKKSCTVRLIDPLVNELINCCRLKYEDITGFIGGLGSTLTPRDDEPMILRRRDVQQIYVLELKPR